MEMFVKRAKAEDARRETEATKVYSQDLVTPNDEDDDDTVAVNEGRSPKRPRTKVDETCVSESAIALNIFNK